MVSESKLFDFCERKKKEKKKNEGDGGWWKLRCGSANFRWDLKREGKNIKR